MRASRFSTAEWAKSEPAVPSPAADRQIDPPTSVFPAFRRSREPRRMESMKPCEPMSTDNAAGVVVWATAGAPTRSMTWLSDPVNSKACSRQPVPPFRSSSHPPLPPRPPHRTQRANRGDDVAVHGERFARRPGPANPSGTAASIDELRGSGIPAAFRGWHRRTSCRP